MRITRSHYSMYALSKIHSYIVITYLVIKGHKFKSHRELDRLLHNYNYNIIYKVLLYIKNTIFEFVTIKYP